MIWDLFALAGRLPLRFGDDMGQPVSQSDTVKRRAFLRGVGAARQAARPPDANDTFTRRLVSHSHAIDA